MTFPNINPIIFSIGPLAISWYSLSYVVGILLGWFYANKIIEKFKPQITKKNLEDFITYAVIGIIVGGRLGFVLLYNPSRYFSHPIDILKTYEGGMSFHGGALGLIIAAYLFCRKYKVNFLSLTDIIAPVVPIGLFLGRITNFINGELYGRITNSSFGMIFPNSDLMPRHPSQLYEAFFEGLVLFCILAYATFKHKTLKKCGLNSGIFLIFYALFRIAIEIFREPDIQIGFILDSLTMGQILSVPMLLLGSYFNMSIESKIRQSIEQNGYITCDVLMQEVLQSNPTSYYKQVKSLASEGDFVTAPEISQLFGEIIGLWCIKEWQRIGCPKSLSLVELGPGRGLLMRDLLRTAKLVPEFYKALSIELIEINQNFIAHQKANLQDINLPISHRSFVEDIQKKPTIIIANEFFDAMPIKQYIKVKELWYERIFVVQPVDGRIKYDKISVNKQLQEYLLRTHIEAKDGAVLEESYNSIEIIKFIAQHLKKLSGSCLIIDYGYDIAPNDRTRYQYNPTLQAVKNHKYCPILENLGEADLSAHVDFYTLKTVAKNSKINVIDTISQRDFLIENGILLRKQTLQDKLSEEQAGIIEKQVERLISSKQMGTLFKVLQITN